MTMIRSQAYLNSMIKELQTLPRETQWVEFKYNNSKPQEIGEYLSALANSAALLGKINAYLVWGIDNDTHEIVGTDFRPENIKIGNEELENWLLRLLSPKINFHFYSLDVNELPIVLLEIGAAFRHPVKFQQQEFIRVGSYKKNLKDHPEKERELWRAFDQIPFEKEIAAENVSADDVLKLLNYPAYFDMTNLPLPDNRFGILDALKSEEMIAESNSNYWNITNLGAILFAKKLTDFSHLKRKAIRIIQYKENSKLETIREEVNEKGYAVGYEEIIKTIMQLVPSNEIIEHAFRKEISMFPEIAIRELVANAMIHQDFHARGTSTTVELFPNRVEITNPGLPLVKIDRFLDSPPASRNEGIASFMRRINICEERGTGIDKVVIQTELYQLPAPVFRTTDAHTIAILFAHKSLIEMDKRERIQACYLHASLKYVQSNFLTNSSIRERFVIEDQNMATASRIIRETAEAGLIRLFDKNAAPKFRKYVPYWA